MLQGVCCSVLCKKRKKRGNRRKTQISCRFGSKQGPRVLPAPSAGLLPSAFQPPCCLRASQELLKNHISLGEWKNTTLRRWKCRSVGARGREEQRVASANCRKSDTVIQSCSGGLGRELVLAVRWEKWSWIPFITILLRQHGQIVSRLCCPSFPSRSEWD